MRLQQLKYPRSSTSSSSEAKKEEGEEDTDTVPSFVLLQYALKHRRVEAASLSPDEGGSEMSWDHTHKRLSHVFLFPVRQ